MSNLESGASEAQLIDLFQNFKMPIIGAGGGFAPIGTRGYFEGQIAPQGWLICDGSTKNIADYPDLATYIASQQGSVNYYGGDGITTFGLPTMNGMPNSGVDTPDEHIVSEWRETRDGVLKKKPVYEKTLTGKTSQTSGTDSQLGTIANLEKVISMQSTYLKTAGYWSQTPEDETNAHVVVSVRVSDNAMNVYAEGSYRTNADVIAVIQYTKTTDEWGTVQEGHSADGNGVFCIKATVAGDPNAHVYSTEEQVVGKWIDGRDLYEKTISGKTPISTGSVTDATFASLPSNCFIVDIKGGLTMNYNGHQYNQGVFTYYDSNNYFKFYSIDNELKFLFAGNVYGDKDANIIVQYTKTV